MMEPVQTPIAIYGQSWEHDAVIHPTSIRRDKIDQVVLLEALRGALKFIAHSK